MQWWLHDRNMSDNLLNYFAEIHAVERLGEYTLS